MLPPSVQALVCLQVQLPAPPPEPPPPPLPAVPPALPPEPPPPPRPPKPPPPLPALPPLPLPPAPALPPEPRPAWPPLLEVPPNACVTLPPFVELVPALASEPDMPARGMLAMPPAALPESPPVSALPSPLRSGWTPTAQAVASAAINRAGSRVSFNRGRRPRDIETSVLSDSCSASDQQPVPNNNRRKICRFFVSSGGFARPSQISSGDPNLTRHVGLGRKKPDQRERDP